MNARGKRNSSYCFVPLIRCVGVQSVGMPLQDLRPQGGAPSWTLICPLPRRAAQAPEFPSLLQASAWHIQLDTPSRRDYLPLVEVHGLFS